MWDKSTFTEEYAVFLKKLREAGVTQVELAERIGNTQSFVSKCERGERRLNFVEVHAFVSFRQACMSRSGLGGKLAVDSTLDVEDDQCENGRANWVKIGWGTRSGNLIDGGEAADGLGGFRQNFGFWR